MSRRQRIPVTRRDDQVTTGRPRSSATRRLERAPTRRAGGLLDVLTLAALVALILGGAAFVCIGLVALLVTFA